MLTRKLADRYFGSAFQQQYSNLIGRLVTVNKKPYHISAILEDAPRNSNITFSIILPFKVFENNNQKLVNNWKEIYSESFVFAMLPANYRIASFEAALQPFKNKYLDKEIAQNTSYHAQPLNEIHTDETYGGTYYATPAILIVAFVTMGIIILLTACINFINLATAQSLKRTKEIGIRKTLGSRNWQLILRFMGETLLLIAAAAGIGLYLAGIFLDSFNNYLSFIVDLNLHIDNSIILFLLVMVLLITFLAGYYPARIMAGFKPIQALKNNIKASNTSFTSRFSFRKALIVTQFTVSQLLIIGTIVVATQMKYFRSKDMGYQKKGILTVDIPENDRNKLSVFRAAIMSLPLVEDISFSSGPPTSASNSFGDIQRSATTDKIGTERKFVDPHYLNTYKIKLVAGRDLEENDRVTLNDSAGHYNILLNEKAIASLGFKNNQAALGQQIIVNQKDKCTIVGITSNFYNATLKDNINSCLLFYGTNWTNMASIQMKAGSPSATMQYIEQSWKKLFPDKVYKAMTLDEYFRVRAFYIMEDVLYQGFKIFLGLALLVGCLGLYGLVSFLAIQRQKEIGIRKVLGASVNGIVYLFSKEFALLVLIAFLIAAPVGWLAMNAWLQSFANRIDLHAGYFVAALLVSLFIAGATIGFKAVKAALANPVKSLRTE